MSSRKKQFKKLSAGTRTLLLILCIVLIVVWWYGDKEGWFEYNTPAIPATGELEIHFLELGNDYSGDSIYIKAGDVDILVDGGSRQSSADDIYEYVDQYCTDNTLEYVIVTHADQDHIASFVGTADVTGLFDYYEVDTIIDFPRTDKETVLYGKYQDERQQEIDDGNSVHYTALQCYNNEDGAKRVYDLTDSIKMEFLYQKFYEEKASDENDYSVCFQLIHGDKKFLFTGDLEAHGEESLVEHNRDSLGEVELFKAGHHGSKTSSGQQLLDIIQPNIVVVTCVAGSTEYTDITANTFPTQALIDRVAPHTAKMYVTTMMNIVTDEAESFNGDITVVSDENGVTVRCSNNDTVLKDTAWFEDNRIMPAQWGNQ